MDHGALEETAKDFAPLRYPPRNIVVSCMDEEHGASLGPLNRRRIALHEVRALVPQEKDVCFHGR